MSELEEAFDRELRNTYTECVRALNYRPTYLLNMVNEVGGVETARRLLAKDISEGFTKLYEHGRLDLAVESIVLKPEFAPLFSDEELDRARQRLAEARYTPPWLAGGSSTPDPSSSAVSPSLVERLSRAVQNTDPGAVGQTIGSANAVAADQTSATTNRRNSSWIFQSNPHYFDLPGALAALPEMDWDVPQHADKIHAGDTVYLWESGADSGILAVARVLTEPADLAEDEAEQRFNRDSPRFAGTKRRVQLRIEYVLSERIRRADLEKHPALGDISIIRLARGANFALTEEQAVALAALTEEQATSLAALVEGQRELDREDAQLEATDEAEVLDSLQEWQSKIQPSQRVAHRFAHDYPNWLRMTFNGRVVLNALVHLPRRL